MARCFLWLWVIYALVLVVFFTCLVPAAHSHDTSWVSKGNYKNAAGEWCCGTYDCKAYNNVSTNALGWIVEGEMVPFDEAMQVSPPDGQLTICRRPDGSRRCSFGLKPGL